MVAQLLGDGLLAFFGAPLSHEDDPERALHGALRMQASLAELSADLEAAFQLPVQARIGVNAGEVLLGELGSELHLEYLAVGSAVDLAARLEKAAPPGGILVGQDVYRQTRARFEFEGPSELELKGVDGRRYWSSSAALEEGQGPVRCLGPGYVSEEVGRA